MIRWVLECVACSRSWFIVSSVGLKKTDRACPFCGAGGVRVKLKDEEGT